ncbi:hypothetical protein CVT26_013417 [Gymnopilus dilepis]|uniref:Uncharacterized protein n=1 Tax=Gymnopilus dilepis TaxID=231916 RepID=A0A409VV00_9AGAR|nr:hypothetical protein CVT26_013417 [Gymnopilus dilepis]
MPLIDQAPGMPLVEAVISFGEIIDKSRVRFTLRPEYGGGTVSIDLNRCIGNHNGTLVVGSHGFANSSKDVCMPYGLGGMKPEDLLKIGTLRADCAKPDGSFERAELQLREYLRFNKKSGKVEFVQRSTGDAILGNLNKMFGGGTPVGPAFSPGVTMMKEGSSPWDENGRHWHEDKGYFEDKMGYHVWDSTTPAASKLGHEEVTVTSTEEESLLYRPRILVFNVGRTRTKQISHGPLEFRALLPAFLKALESIRTKGYIVANATYSTEGASIFIETADEDWDAQVKFQ